VEYFSINYLTIDRKINSLGYLPDNSFSCCWFCNNAKSDNSIDEFKRLIYKIFTRSGEILKSDIDLRKKLLAYKRGAKKRNLSFNLTDQQAIDLFKNQCNYCGQTAYGIDRIKSSIGYQLENCVPCCGDCNLIKLDFDVDFFFSKIKKIYNNMSNF
jgi:hypothetical protein